MSQKTCNYEFIGNEVSPDKDLKHNIKHKFFQSVSCQKYR
jgi:hypothetical protein